MRILTTLSILLFVHASLIECFAQYGVGQTTLALIDTSRSRKVVTELWYPTEKKASTSGVSATDVFVEYPAVKDGEHFPENFPLVLVSHGTGGGRLTMAWLATALAERGFIVAAVDHWGNTWDNKIPECFLRFWERPLDMSFVLSQLLQEPKWSNVINVDNVGAVGFSLGGYTVLALAGGVIDYAQLSRFTATDEGAKEAAIPEMPDLWQYADDEKLTKDYLTVKQRLHDPRIRHFVAIAPALGQGFDITSLRGIEAPVLIIGAAADSIAPIKTNSAHIAKQLDDGRLQVLEGSVGHYVFLNECTSFGKEVAGFICTDDSSVNRAHIHEKVIEQISNFISAQ